MRNHITQLESQFSKLAAVGSKTEEQKKVTILLSSLNERQELAHSIASMHTVQEEMANWTYVTNTFIEENKRLKNQKATMSNQDKTVHLAATVTKPQAMQRRQINQTLQTQRCYNCNRIGRYSRECQTRNN